MNDSDLYIANVLVARPVLPLNIGYFDLTKSERTSSGVMLMDIIRQGIRRVDVTWEYLPDSELMKILQTITANKPFFSLKYPGPGGQQNMTCYCGDISTSLWHRIGGVRYWDKVTIPFIER